MSNKTIVFDFDGVIHSYTSGWHGVDVIPDEPCEEVVAAIRKLRKAGYEVVVVSTRCADPRGMKAVQEYLKRHGIKVDNVCATKPPALVYVDDRAVCYRPGIDLVKRIVEFRPWRDAPEATCADALMEELRAFAKGDGSENSAEYYKEAVEKLAQRLLTRFEIVER